MKNPLKSNKPWNDTFKETDSLTLDQLRSRIPSADYYIVNLQPALHNLESFLKVVKAFRTEKHLKLKDKMLAGVFELGQSYAIMTDPEDMSTVKALTCFAKIKLENKDSVPHKLLPEGKLYVQLANFMTDGDLECEVSNYLCEFTLIDAQPQSLCNQTLTAYGIFESDFDILKYAQNNDHFYGRMDCEDFWQGSPNMNGIHAKLTEQVRKYGCTNEKWFGIVFNYKRFPKIANKLAPLIKGPKLLDCGKTLALFDSTLGTHPRERMYDRLISRDKATMRKYRRIVEFKTA